MSDLTTNEAATQLETSVSTVRRWLEAGYFPSAWRVPGGHWRIPTADVETFRARYRESKALISVYSAQAAQESE